MALPEIGHSTREVLPRCHDDGGCFAAVGGGGDGSGGASGGGGGGGASGGGGLTSMQCVSLCVATFFHSADVSMFAAGNLNLHLVIDGSYLCICTSSISPYIDLSLSLYLSLSICLSVSFSHRKKDTCIFSSTVFKPLFGNLFCICL